MIVSTRAASMEWSRQTPENENMKIAQVLSRGFRSRRKLYGQQSTVLPEAVINNFSRFNLLQNITRTQPP